MAGGGLLLFWRVFSSLFFSFLDGSVDLTGFKLICNACIICYFFTRCQFA